MRWFNRGADSKEGAAPRAGSSVIDLRRVVKTYQSTAGTFTALGGINLQVERGEFLAVIGKSGSGKSTLTNMITGIDRPTSGEVWVYGTPLHTLSEGRMAVWRGQALGIIFQFFQLLPTLTLLENVLLPMDFCNSYPPRERRTRAMELLDLVEMAQNADKLPSAVSGGQQQRAAIARALANDPPIIVADEPTGNLDSKTANNVFQLFERLIAHGKTIVMVTHDGDLARRVSRAVIVADGQIVDEIRNRRPHVQHTGDSGQLWLPPIELSAIERAIITYTPQARFFTFLRQRRHVVFDAAFQEQLTALYDDIPQRRPLAPAAQLALAVMLQVFSGKSDDGVLEATIIDRRWQMALDCLDAQKPPFTISDLRLFRKLLAHKRMRQQLMSRIKVYTTGLEHRSPLSPLHPEPTNAIPYRTVASFHAVAPDPQTPDARSQVAEGG
jgi:putative ABC transport system ATP-binding protein